MKRTILYASLPWLGVLVAVALGFSLGYFRVGRLAEIWSDPISRADLLVALSGVAFLAVSLSVVFAAIGPRVRRDTRGFTPHIHSR
jgi:hypothetical protein